MLSMRQLIGTPGPVIERGECHFVYLPSGELRECDGLADGERILDEAEQCEQLQWPTFDMAAFSRSLGMWDDFNCEGK
jgi:hypothetical protein